MGNRRVLAGFCLVALIAVGVVGVTLLRSGAERGEPVAMAAPKMSTPPAATPAAMPAEAAQPVEQTTNITDEPQPIAAASEPESAKLPLPPGSDLSYMKAPDFDPEAQPRTFWMRDFREMTALPEGYKADGLRLTANGIELEPAAEEQEGQPRTGVLESAPELMDFQWNDIVPLWRQQAPDGTGLVFEVAASPDGENWTDWIALEMSEDEISPTYPDGRPNPNFGFRTAGPQFGSLQLWNFTRYRVTFHSETAASPTLEAFRLYVMDSTFGEGRLAEIVPAADEAEAATP